MYFQGSSAFIDDCIEFWLWLLSLLYVCLCLSSLTQNHINKLPSPCGYTNLYLYFIHNILACLSTSASSDSYQLKCSMTKPCHTLLSSVVSPYNFSHLELLWIMWSPGLSDRQVMQTSFRSENQIKFPSCILFLEPVGSYKVISPFQSLIIFTFKHYILFLLLLTETIFILLL